MTINPFKNYHLEILSQIEKLVGELSHDEFIAKSKILGGSSLGQHIRHIIEFYVCLFSEKNYVNYDERERNLLIENSPVYTKSVIAQIKTNIQNISLENPVVFKQYIGEEEVFLQSNFARELIYLSEHTIHHFALIKIGIADICPDVSVDQNFGVAASTLKFRDKQNQEKCVS
jgi:hypothetical protein